MADPKGHAGWEAQEAQEEGPSELLAPYSRHYLFSRGIALISPEILGDSSLNWAGEGSDPLADFAAVRKAIDNQIPGQQIAAYLEIVHEAQERINAMIGEQRAAEGATNHDR